MLEIVPRNDKFVIRRDCESDDGGSRFEYWAGDRWSKSIASAKAFDSQDEAEDCRVVG